MKKNKYSIHPDFKLWTYINPPLDPVSVFFIQKAMEPLFYLEKSDASILVEKKTIRTKAHKIPVLIYTPAHLKNQKTPCLMIYHGGGYALPAFTHHFKLARQYALEASCRVVFVNYSLAPKHPFPKAIFECFKAYEWVLKNADSLNIDASKIGVGGDSAGGQLSVDVCISAKRKGLPLPCLQMLIYPACTWKVETASMLEFTDTPMCNSKDSDKYLAMYLKSEDISHPEYLNLIDADLTNMPPTYIETTQYDCLRDGALLFADRLKENNIEVIVNSTEETMHGYDIALSSAIVKENVCKRIDFLNTYLYK